MVSKDLGHRDLAARNVLVGNDKVVKISDFGLIRNVSGNLIYMANTDRMLPIKWMSPEAILDEEFTMCSDVYVYFCNTLFLNLTLLFDFYVFIFSRIPHLNLQNIFSLLSNYLNKSQI